MDDALFTRAPHWGWHAVLYFFVGGIAAGSFVLAAVADLFGTPQQRVAARRGYLVAFPAVVVGGALLVWDLTRPERFWHMLFASERPGLMFKAWSPMSLGAWALLLFGGAAFLAFLGAVAERRGGRPRTLAALARGAPRSVLAVVGGLLAFFVGGYTGVLLAATNRPLWSETAFVGPVFLLSAASTSAALLILLARRGDDARWMSRFDSWTLVAEAVALVALCISLGPVLRLWAGGWGAALALGTGVAGILVPLALRRRRESGPRAEMAASALVLVGGLVLRAVVVLSVEAA